jgi:hypothetical protein
MEVDTGATKESGVKFVSTIQSDYAADLRDRPMTVLQR